MTNEEILRAVRENRTALGIELGSSRIKAVLIGPDHQPIATGSYAWENRLEDGLWTYSLEDVWTGLRACYAALSEKVRSLCGQSLTSVGSMGISAMMHGYLAFDQRGKLLAPFRTWRNTNTQQAAQQLTQALGFNIPLRWSAAHFYQAVLNKESHTQDVVYLTTLSGYVHWKLTGEKVLGVGDASGMFPVDSEKCDYDARMLERYDEMLHAAGARQHLRDLLPKVLRAGQAAGRLTPEGAQLLDPTGALQAGITLCPPEGDAGTGMVATNSVLPRTGNVSMGTSVFAMIVLEKPLSKVYPEIDLVTTPSAHPVAMVHCNNGTSDLDAWAGMLREFAAALGVPCTLGQALDVLFAAARAGQTDCGGVVNWNYVSGEPITGLNKGCPMLVRRPDSSLSLGNFARAQLYSIVASLALGMDLLLRQEQVQLDRLMGHGGFFKAAQTGQQVLADAMGVPVSVMETAGEGGPWGMALLAAYLAWKQPDESLEDYLSGQVFRENGNPAHPSPEGQKGFQSFLKGYQSALEAERYAAEHL